MELSKSSISDSRNLIIFLVSLADDEHDGNVIDNGNDIDDGNDIDVDSIVDSNNGNDDENFNTKTKKCMIFFDAFPFPFAAIFIRISALWLPNSLPGYHNKL